MKKIALAALLLAGGAGTALAGSYDDLNAGIQHFNSRRWNDAIVQFDKVIADASLSADLKFIALYDRAASRGSLGQLDQAIADYTSALALRPNEVQVLVDRTSAYLLTGKNEQAIGDIDRVIGLRPTFAHGYGLRALINVKRGEAEKSRQDFKTSVKLASKNIRNQSFGIVNWLWERSTLPTISFPT